MSENNYDPTEHEPLPEGKEAPPPLTHAMSIVRWVILVAMSLFALGMILSSIGFAPWEARADSTVQYHCPMHPTYISNQPGECPICGMNLVPIDKSGKEIKTTKAKADTKITKSSEKVDAIQYTCPMHPEVISDKPGSCPKCGMDLVKQIIMDSTMIMPDSSSMPAKISKDMPMESQKDDKAAVIYACPMDPEVTSEKPGRCPKCGMFLKPVSVDTSKSMPMPKAEPDKSGEIQSMPGIDMSNTNDTSMGKAPVPGLVPVTIEPERLQLIGVKTAEVTERNIGGAINIVGSVTSDESRIKNLTTRVNGWVQDLYVDKTGQYVEAGKPLLSIYSQELYQAEQDYIIARDAINETSSDSSLTIMRNQIYSSANDRLRLMGLSENQINEIEKLDSPSEKLMIKSPFSGYVLVKNVLPGQYLSPDQNLFTIADLSKVWVLGDVYEQDIAGIHVGQRATMHLTAFPGEDFEGAINYIYPSISEQTHTLKIRIEFDNPSIRIRPGMYAEISLESGNGQTLSVPSDAVLDGGNEQYVFVIHDGIHFEPRLVKTGHTSDDYTEILSGLHAGERVVSSANFLIDSESRLKAAVAGMSTMPDMPDMPKTEQGTAR